MKPQYRNYNEIDLDILDTHIQAMTAEKLHGKAEIARELAWRDEQIVRLEDELKDTKERAGELLENWGSYASDYFKEKHNLQADIDSFKEN